MHLLVWDTEKIEIEVVEMPEPPNVYNIVKCLGYPQKGKEPNKQVAETGKVLGALGNNDFGQMFAIRNGRVINTSQKKGAEGDDKGRREQGQES